MDKHLVDIKGYFNLDPLMVPLFVYLCPKNDLPVLCDHVPLYMVIAVICHALQSNIYPLKKFEVFIDETEISVNLRKELKVILTPILNDRIACIPPAETKVQLFFDLEKRKNPKCNEVVLNVVMDHAVNSLEQMFSSQQVT